MDEADVFDEEYFPVDPDADMEISFHEEEMNDFPVSIEQENPSIEVCKEAEEMGITIVESPGTPADPDFEDVVPLLLPPNDASAFFSVSSEQNRVYLRERAQDKTISDSTRSSRFLAKSISELREIATAQSLKRDEELSKWIQMSSASLDRDSRQFVDKYKPVRFIDLLSDDAINRQMLGWLSEWKKNSTHPSSSITISAPTVPNGSEMHTQNKKVLLIGGGPGVGKSALIDVCCRHFQYQVIESNASDDRGKQAVLKVISDVCGNRSVIDSSKPQVLVIEEIDGDECTAADVLVNILERNPETIKRPVICVCSDVYQKNLKSLREFSTVISMTHPKQLRLIEKVKVICNQEKIKIESLAIDRLVQLCECDIRSCLNQLQALASRLGHDSAETIKVADVSKYVGNDGNSRAADAAVKDNQKSEYELMQLLFEPKRSRGKDYKDTVTSAISNAKSLPSSVWDVFAHCIVTVPFTDVSLRYTKSSIELISLSDVGVMTGMSLAMKYASHWCAAVGKPRIDIQGARKLISSRYNKKADRDAITSALVKSSLHSSRGSRAMMGSKSAWGLYYSRLALLIMSPEHNPVWVKKSASVHPEIERIARIYTDWGIELTEESNQGDISATQRHIYVMNPNFRLLSELEFDGSIDEVAIPYFSVGSPMGEILKTTVHNLLTKAKSGQESTVEVVARGSKRSIAPSPQVTESKKTRTAINISSWALPKGDPSAQKSSTTTGGSVVVKKYPFEFRFNEGHTNAVKRVLHLKDFLVQRI